MHERLNGDFGPNLKSDQASPCLFFELGMFEPSF